MGLSLNLKSCLYDFNIILNSYTFNQKYFNQVCFLKGFKQVKTLVLKAASGVYGAICWTRRHITVSQKAQKYMNNLNNDNVINYYPGGPVLTSKQNFRLTRYR